MGQAESSEETSVAILHGKIQQNVIILKKAATLTYTDFLKSVTELNQITQTFTDRYGKQLLFAVKSGTDDTILWKGTVRIQLLKVDTRSNRVESSRLLNLRQFIILWQEITEQTNTGLLNQSEEGASSISMLLKGVDESRMDQYDPEECCICMENKSEIILACEHKFCENCIDTWNVSNRTCPICRARVESKDDTWVITEKPDNDEYASEVKGYLMGLADRTGAPQ